MTNRSTARRSARLVVLVLAVGGVAAGILATSAALAQGGAGFTVHSSLDGKTVLPLRIHWIAHPQLPAGQVKEVDFLIDGRLGWVEKKTPYVYADDGNWLVTSFLAAKKHTFTVRVVSTTGTVVSDTVTARVVAPPAPPSNLAGTWSRTVTGADVLKATSGQPPPPGRWKVTIEKAGWHMTDPQNGGGLFDVAYLSATRLQMRPTIESPPFPNPSNGGFCGDTDPLATWTATVSSDGKSLTIGPATKDPCGDRVAILQGTWTRSG